MTVQFSQQTKNSSLAKYAVHLLESVYDRTELKIPKFRYVSIFDSVQSGSVGSRNTKLKLSDETRGPRENQRPLFT